MCVLLVEDEPLIREIMAEGLAEAGYEVVEAEDGEEAVALIRTSAERFSVLVTDFHMPGQHDGAAVANCLRKRLPDIPVVIATGRPEVLQQTWRKELRYTLVRKPYTSAYLVELLNGILAP